MKKLLWIILAFALVSCQQVQTPLMTATRYRVIDTPAASAIPPIATRRPLATATPSPKPTSLELPAVPGKMPAHKLALTEFNTGTGMKLLNVYGTGVLNDFAFSPDGNYLAAATSRGIFLYDRQTFKEISFIDVHDRVFAIAFSPTDPILAVSTSGKVSLWNILSGQKMSTMEGDFSGTLAYGKGEYVAAIGPDCPGCYYSTQMAIWDAKTGQQIYGEKGLDYAKNALAFTRDGKHLAYGGKGGLTLWDTETKEGNLISESDQASLAPYTANLDFSFIFSNDALSLFVVGSGDTSLKVEIASGKIGEFYLCHSNLVASSTLGGCIAGDSIVLFDLATGEKRSEITIPDAENSYHWDRKITLSPDGDLVAYRSNDVLRILNGKTGQEIKAFTFSSFEKIQTDIVLFNGQQTYVAAIPDQFGQVDLVNIENGAHLQTYSLPSAKIADFAFRPDQKTVATWDDSQTLTLWDIQAQHALYQLTPSENLAEPFTFSPNGLELFFTNRDLDIFKLQGFSGNLSLEGRNSYSMGYAQKYVHNNYHFNQAGHLILLNYVDDNPTITDTVTKQSKTIPFVLTNDQRSLEVEDYTLNPDNALIALGTSENIFVWNMQTLKQISMLAGHEVRGGEGFFGMIRSVLFNPQSDLLVSVGYDGTTRLWNTHVGQELRRLNVCCQASFTPDGRYLVTVGDGALRVWGIPALVP